MTSPPPGDRHLQLYRTRWTPVELIVPVHELGKDQRRDRAPGGRPGQDRHVRMVGWVVVISTVVIRSVIMIMTSALTGPLMVVNGPDLDLDALEGVRHGHDQRTDLSPDVQQHRSLPGVGVLGVGHVLGVPGRLWKPPAGVPR